MTFAWPPDLAAEGLGLLEQLAHYFAKLEAHRRRTERGEPIARATEQPSSAPAPSKSAVRASRARAPRRRAAPSTNLAHLDDRAIEDLMKRKGSL